jgi:hypothetical protein
MTVSTTAHTALRGALVAGLLFTSLLFLGGQSNAPKLDPRTWGDPVNGLQIALNPAYTNSRLSKFPQFDLNFRNVTKNDLTLNLGNMLGNGQQYPMEVVLILTDVQGKSQRLEMRGPPVAGRIYPYVLDVYANSVSSIRLYLDTYLDVLPSGQYFLEAEYQGPNDNSSGLGSSMNVPNSWRGTVKSNQVRFEIPKPFPVYSNSVGKPSGAR